MGMYGGAGDPGAEARQQEQQRQLRVGEGLSSIDNSFKGFDDNYFNGKQQAYRDYYSPQLNKQYQDSKDAMLLRLSDAGIGQSSAAAHGLSRLTDEYARNSADVEQKAQGYGSETRADVQGLKNQLVSQLNATGDSGLAAQAANSAVALQRSKSSGFEPLANAFTDISGLYARDQQNANYANALNQPYQTYGARLKSSAAGKLVS